MVKKRALRTGDGSHPYCVEMMKKGKIEENNNREVINEARSEVYWGLGELKKN